MLNLILASLFFAVGYGVAYFTGPRETVIIREHVYYYANETCVINNTIVYNYTIPANHTYIVNNTVVINDTRVIIYNDTLPLIRFENTSYVELTLNVSNLARLIIPILVNGSLYIEIYYDLTAWCPEYNRSVTVPALIEIAYNGTHLLLHWGVYPVTAKFSGVGVLQITSEDGGYQEATEIFGLTNWSSRTWSLDGVESIAYTVNIVNYVLS